MNLKSQIHKANSLEFYRQVDSVRIYTAKSRAISSLFSQAQLFPRVGPNIKGSFTKGERIKIALITPDIKAKEKQC